MPALQRRLHNPNLRIRGKRKNASAAGLAQYVKLAFWGLLVVSIGLAGYLLRRVGQTLAVAAPSRVAPGGTGTGSHGAATSGGGSNNLHHVSIGDEHHLPVVETPSKNAKPNLRKPFVEPKKEDPPKPPPIQVAPKEPVVPQTVAATEHHVAATEHQDIGGQQQTDKPTLSPIQQLPRPKSNPEEPQDVNPVEQMLEEQAVATESAHAVVLNKQGSGPTNVGFVKDFAHERIHPLAWNVATATTKAQERVATVAKLAGLSLKSCTDGASGGISALCRDADTMLYAYNNANFTRTLCGMELEPHTVVKLDSLTDHACLVEPTRHILPLDSIPLDGTGMQPVQIVAHEDGGHTAKLQTIDCDVPCEYDVSLMFDEPPRERYVHGEGWKILYDTPEKPKPMEKLAWKQDIYYSGPSRQSSIPVSTYDFAKFDFREAHAISYKDAERAASYFADDQCKAGGTKRHRWMYSLQNQPYTVHSYGQCDHNTDADVSTLEARLDLMRKSRLVLAYEASNDKDAFTDLTWEAFQSGAVPVIVGPSNAQQVLPPHSFIWFGHYNNWDKFSEEVVRVADDEQAWLSYQEWRNDDAVIEAFEKSMNFTRTSLECRTCRWAYAKMYGLNWDVEQQQIRPSTIPRDEFCVAKFDPERLLKPFKELWPGLKDQGDEEESECHQNAIDQETVMEMEGYSVTRHILHHDGVTDLLLKELEVTDTSKPIVLRLEFNIKNYEGAYFPYTHTQVESNNLSPMSSATIQDFKSRVTVLADWKTEISSPEEGAIIVQLPPSLEETRRIRIIMEDVQSVNFKLTEFYPFAVGKKMMQDFVNPVELYYPAVSRR